MAAGVMLPTRSLNLVGVLARNSVRSESAVAYLPRHPTEHMLDMKGNFFDERAKTMSLDIIELETQQKIHEEQEIYQAQRKSTTASSFLHHATFPSAAPKTR
jgi:hypothetical protein